jgi:hypothetical protein
LTCLREIGEVVGMGYRGDSGDSGDRGDRGGGVEGVYERLEFVDGGEENGGYEEGSDGDRRIDLSMGGDGGVVVWRAAT